MNDLAEKDLIPDVCPGDDDLDVARSSSAAHERRELEWKLLRAIALDLESGCSVGDWPAPENRAHVDFVDYRFGVIRQGQDQSLVIVREDGEAWFLEITDRKSGLTIEFPAGS